MEKQKCRNCQEEFDDEDIYRDGLCLDCYLEAEEIDFEIWRDQDGECAICGITMVQWQISNGKAVCSKHLIE